MLIRDLITNLLTGRCTVSGVDEKWRPWGPVRVDRAVCRAMMGSPAVLWPSAPTAGPSAVMAADAAVADIAAGISIADSLHLPDVDPEPAA